MNLRDRVIGRLQPEDRGIFEDSLQDARAARQTLMTSGYLEAGSDTARFFA